MIPILLLTTAFLGAAEAAPPRGQTPDLLFEEVVLGETHGCGRRADGTVACWGKNDRGQLGDVTFDDSPFPRDVADLTDVVALAAGRLHTCAVLRDRRLRCWGDNQTGQLGGGTLSAQPKPVDVEGIGPVLAVAAGDAHTCAITLDRSVSCWGNNLHGQVGVPGLRTVPRPVPVPGVKDMNTLAAGYGHTCAAGSDGVPWCWGDGSHGELGRTPPADGAPQAPAPIEGELPPVRLLAARHHQTCALTAEGVWCWGSVPTDPTPRPAAAKQVAARGLVALSLGWGHGCAATGAGEVVCFGDDRLGQLGALSPRDGVSHGAYGLRGVTSVAAGLGESCAARGAAGRTVCWGSPTMEEKQAAKLEVREVEVTPPPRRRALPLGTELVLSMEEVLGPDQSRIRVTVQTVEKMTCANTRLDNVVTTKGKRVILELGDPYLPGGNCIAGAAPAAAHADIPGDTIGRRDIVLRWKRHEDFYQLFVTQNRLEVIPLESTFSYWEGDKALQRVPPGSLAISCVDHLEAPLCQRRLRDQLPTCADVLGHARVREAPRLDGSKKYASPWFTADPQATLLSPDFHHEGYRTLFEDDFRDGSGCLDLRVRTWRGEVWRNDHPATR